MTFHAGVLSSDNLSTYCNSAFNSFWEIKNEGWRNGTEYNGFLEKDSTNLYDIVDDFSWNGTWVITSKLTFEKVTNSQAASWLDVYQISVLNNADELLYMATGSLLAVT